MNLADVWQAISDACSAIVGVNCTPYEPLEPLVPALFPTLPETGSYNETFDNTTDFTLTVRLLVAQEDQKVATENLLPYMSPTGPQSVKAALEDNMSLGGAVDSIAVVGWSNAGTISYGQLQYLGVDFTVNVLG